MRIILLATNETKKLAPLHTSFAGPMLPIVNRPVMAASIEMLARAGYKQIYASLCHSAGSIAEYFGNGSRWGVHIDYVIQRESLGSAGALRWAERLLDDTVLVLPADSILDLDIDAALAYHQSHDGPVTAILSPQRRPASAAVQLDATQQLRAVDVDWTEDAIYSYTGAYILEPAALRYIPRRMPYDLYAQFLPALLENQVAVYGYPTEAYWNPLQSFAELQEAQRVFLYSAYQTEEQQHPPDLPRVRYPSIEGRQVAPGVWVGRNHVIHPSVRIAAPISIGEHCWIGQQTEIGAGTVIGNNVVIDNGATVNASTVLEQTYVGQFVRLNQRLVHANYMIDPASSACTELVDPFLLSEVRQLTGRRRRRHRILTRLFVSSVIILLSPFLLLLGLAVMVMNGGRLFRREPSVGRRPIDATHADSAVLPGAELLVFETRRSNGDVSGFGNWMLRTELYRLPMLWNVLKGDLALVGVKPLSRLEATRLDEEWHQKRFERPIGFTGLWYLQTAAGSELEEVLVADAYYVATRTWFMDLRILCGTPRAWWRKRSQSPPDPLPGHDLLRADG